MSKKNPSGDAKSKSKKNMPGADSASIPQLDPVVSEQPNDNAAMMPPQSKDDLMLSLKSLDKRGRNAIYTGAAVSIRIPIGAFPNKTAPAIIPDSDGVFATSREKKAPMTAEERKVARKTQPKLTLAEKVAKAEERTERLRQKLAADVAKASAQPSL